MEAKRALVTGASGFVGSNLTRFLVQAGWDVGVIVRETSNLDVLGKDKKCIRIYLHDGTASGMNEIVSDFSPLYIFHLASVFISDHKHSDVDQLISSNILFSTYLAEAACRSQVPYFINTSTSWQYYESCDYRPVNLYAATKQAFEDILKYYSSAQGLKVINLALFDTYGPGDRRQKLMHLLWRTAMEQQDLRMSPGDQMLDIVYIDDVVEAFVGAAEQIVCQKGSIETYAVSSGRPLSLRDLVNEFEHVTGYSLPILWGGRSYREREVMVTWTSFKQLPNWSPKVPLCDGIRNSRPELKQLE